MFPNNAPRYSKFRNGLDNITIRVLFSRFPDTTPEGTSGSISLRCILDGKNLNFSLFYRCGEVILHFPVLACSNKGNFFFRSTHEVVEIDGAIYSLGGNDGSASLNSMER